MVAPYKPQEDCASVSDSPTSIKACSDRAPLLNGDKSETKKNGISLNYFNLKYFNLNFSDMFIIFVFINRFNDLVG